MFCHASEREEENWGRGEGEGWCKCVCVHAHMYMFLGVLENEGIVCVLHACSVASVISDSLQCYGL